MAVDYARLAILARRLIQENGREVLLIQPSLTPDDPLKPWRGPNDAGPADQLTVSAVVFVGAEKDDETAGIRVQGPGSCLFEQPTTGENLKLYHTMNDRGVLRRLSEITELDPGSPGPIFYYAVIDGSA